jgi:hypothetical protein
VPTVINFVLEGQFVSERRSAAGLNWAFTAALGTCPRVSEPGLLAQGKGVLAAVKLSVPHGTMAVDKQITPTPYNHMTRIAAAGGSVSGSPPAWDPV